MTLATCRASQAWSTHCFYTYDRMRNMFIIISETNTRHIDEVSDNPRVSGGIALETKNIGKIRGLQFTGRLMKAEGKDKKHCRKLYLKRFPFAALANIDLWMLPMEYAKFTDNRLGFGKKIIWEQENEN